MQHFCSNNSRFMHSCTLKQDGNLTCIFPQQETHFSQIHNSNLNLPVKWWELSHGRRPLPAEAPCMSHPHPPLPDRRVKTHGEQVNCASCQAQNLAPVMRKNWSRSVYHVPKLVEGHNKAWAYTPQTLEGPDVNFDPDPLLHAFVQLPQRTALAYWKHMTQIKEEFTWNVKMWAMWDCEIARCDDWVCNKHEAEIVLLSVKLCLVDTHIIKINSRTVIYIYDI